MFISDIIIKIFTKKHFSDNNILKEEPNFCAWTRSPQKCSKGLNTVKITQIKIRNPKNKKSQKEIQQPTTKETMQRIFTPYSNRCSLARNESRRRPGGGGNAFERGKVLLRGCKETKSNSDIAFCQLSLPPHSQLQEQSSAPFRWKKTKELLSSVLTLGPIRGADGLRRVCVGLFIYLFPLGDERLMIAPSPPFSVFPSDTSSNKENRSVGTMRVKG